MAKTIEQLKAQSAEVKNATVVGENTATRVGTLFTDIVEYMEQVSADGAVTTKKLAPLAVTTEKIANGAVTTEKLADSAMSQAMAQAIEDENKKRTNYNVVKNNIYNLIDNNSVKGGYIDNNGNYIGNLNFLCSDYSIIPEGANYIIFKGSALGTSVCYIAAYDENLNFIKSQKVSDGNIQMFDISDTENVRFIRYSVHKNSVTLRAEVASDLSQSNFQYPETYSPISGWNKDLYDRVKANTQAIEDENKKRTNYNVVKNNIYNLIDNNSVKGGYIDNNGNYIGNLNFLCSDYSIIPEGANYIIFKGSALGTSVCYIAAYDENLNFIKSQKVSDGNIQMFDISDTENVRFIRYSVHKNSVTLRAEVASDLSQSNFQYPETYSPISGWNKDLYDKVEANTQAIEDLPVKTKRIVVCLGDSLTANGGDDSYPRKLQSILGNKYEVHNFGIGGDSTIDICARCGAITAETSVDFNIPMSKDTIFTLPRVEDEKGNIIDYGIVSSISGGKIHIYENGGYFASNTITPLTINNMEFDVQNSTINGDVVLKTKEEITVELQVKKGTPVIMNGYRLCQEADIIVVNMGANGGYNIDINGDNNIVEQFKRIKDKFNCKYLFVTPHTNNMYDGYRTLMAKTFGANYLDSRQYFSTKAIYDALSLGLVNSVTEQDLEDMGKGNCPQSLLADTVHFNDIGRTLMANLLYKKLKTIGFIE